MPEAMDKNSVRRPQSRPLAPGDWELDAELEHALFNPTPYEKWERERAARRIEQAAAKARAARAPRKPAEPPPSP